MAKSDNERFLKFQMKPNGNFDLPDFGLKTTKIKLKLIGNHYNNRIIYLSWEFTKVALGPGFLYKALIATFRVC